MTTSVRLPSGALVRVRRIGKTLGWQSDVVDGVPLFAGSMLNALAELRVERADEEGWVDLDRDALLALPLRDFHALRDLAGRLGAIVSPRAEVLCRNCDRHFPIDRTNLATDVVAGRYEEEAPWDPERSFAFPTALPVRHGVRARAVTMREVTVAEVRPYWRALARPGALQVTPSLVRAMGVVSLGGVTQAGPIARALSRAPDAAWRVVEGGFLALAYDPRAVHPQLCPLCGATHEIDAPFEREVSEDVAACGDAAFPDAAEFERVVHRIGKEVYEAKGVRNVALRVEPGVPDVDDAGEPLLGSYEPAAAGLGGDEFLITVYYRTFDKVWQEDGPYDVEGEIRETIDHELTHHLHHLAGHDPLDEEERIEVRRDLERTYGKSALRRAERRVVLRLASIVVGIVGGIALLLFLLERLGVLE